MQARYDRFHIVMEIHAVECRLCAMHGYVRVNFLHCNRTTELYVCSYGDPDTQQQAVQLVENSPF